MHIFQRGWFNHQLVKHCSLTSLGLFKTGAAGPKSEKSEALLGDLFSESLRVAFESMLFHLDLENLRIFKKRPASLQFESTESNESDESKNQNPV